MYLWLDFCFLIFPEELQNFLNYYFKKNTIELFVFNTKGSAIDSS